MLRLKNILVAHDFSTTSRKVMDYAIELAHASGAALDFLHVEVFMGGHIPTTHDKTKAQILRDELQSNFEASIASQGIKRSELSEIRYTVVHDTAPAPAIVDYSRDNDIDCIVMGTHGRRGLRRRLLGSVAEEVVRLAPCPVLTASERLITPSMLERMNTVLVPVDFSDDSKEALRFAKEIAMLHNAEIELVHVVEQRSYPEFYEEKIRAIYYEADLESAVIKQLTGLNNMVEGPVDNIRYKMLHGNPAKEIVDYAAQRKDAMIVIATQGLTGLDRTLMGSVAERVVRLAPVPVITVKTPSPERAD